MRTPVIYKRDASGGIRTWQGEYVNGQWRSHAGLMNGNLVTSEWADAPPRSQATADEQARFECLSQYDKHLAKDYRLTLELVDVPRGSWLKPMLAAIYPGWVGDCHIQPKLDGMRCLMNADGMWSRGAQPIVAAPHVTKELEAFFLKFPYMVLDGELYNHDMHDDFNGLMSVCRKTKSSADDLARSKAVVQYHVYDCCSISDQTKMFSERFEFLIEELKEYNDWRSIVKIVSTVKCNTEPEVMKWHELFVQEGYEGSIIRLDRPYEQKRSRTLLKNKDFITEEFKLIRFEEGRGNWSGLAKSAVCETPGGVQFGAGIRGNKEFCRTLLSENASEYQSVTVRHFGLTPDGSIRIPTAISFNKKSSFENRPALDSTSTENEM